MSYAADTRLNLDFAGEEDPVLNATTFQQAPGSPIHAEGGVAFRWSIGLKAFALCFVEYAEWGAGKPVGDFYFEGASRSSPAATLGNAIQRLEGWLGSIFGTAGNVTQAVFSGSANLSGKATAPRKIAVNSRRLPPNHVQIRLDGCALQDPVQLRKLAERIRQQGAWKHPETQPPCPPRSNGQSFEPPASASPQEHPSGPAPIAYPFRRVTKGWPLFSINRTSLTPSWDDYLENRVYRHPVREEVQSRLEASGLALVLVYRPIIVFTK